MDTAQIAGLQAELQEQGWYEDFRDCDGELGPFTLAALMCRHQGQALGAPGRRLARVACEAALDNGWSADQLVAFVPSLVAALVDGRTWDGKPEDQGLCAALIAYGLA